MHNLILCALPVVFYFDWFISLMDWLKHITTKSFLWNDEEKCVSAHWTHPCEVVPYSCHHEKLKNIKPRYDINHHYLQQAWSQYWKPLQVSGWSAWMCFLFRTTISVLCAIDKQWCLIHLLTLGIPGASLSWACVMWFAAVGAAMSW